MSKRTGTLLAFLTGMVIGGALVLLFTPYTGEEVRDRLKREGKKILNRAREDVKNFVEKMEEGIISIEEEE